MLETETQPAFKSGIRELHAFAEGASVKHIATTEKPVESQEELVLWYQGLIATTDLPEGSEPMILVEGDVGFVNGTRPEPRERQTGESLGVEPGRVQPLEPAKSSLDGSDVDTNHDANANPAVKSQHFVPVTEAVLDGTSVLAIQKGIFEKRTRKSHENKVRLMQHMQKFELK